MKKFKSKVKKKKSKKKYIFIFLFLLSIYITFNYLDKSDIVLSDKEFVKVLVSNNYSTNIVSNIYNSIKKNLSIKNIIKTSYVYTDKKKEPVVKDTSPIIYIYNSHQIEEYSGSSFIPYTVNPTVMMADYILEEVFNKNNLNTLVEERSIKEILNLNNWNYTYSYKASRYYIEDVKKNNPSLKYFIDVHRDSLTRDKTTVTINDKDYAKVIFLIGLENPNYQDNLTFTESINNKLNEYYPNLSKGIYKKGGLGVNGVYNQDNSPYTILVEIGGVENTVEEVLNSTLAFSKVFMEVINTSET